jgi:hypothetical protein
MGSEQVAAVLRQSGSHVRLVVARPVEPTSPDYQVSLLKADECNLGSCKQIGGLFSVIWPEQRSKNLKVAEAGCLCGHLFSKL